MKPLNSDAVSSIPGSGKRQSWKAVEGGDETQKDSELHRAVPYDWHHSKSLRCLFLS